MFKRMTLMLLMVAGCGTSDPLFWETCAGCATTVGGAWDVIADGAEINGDYDVVGPPDPYMCLTMKGATHCSSAKSDTSSPRWSETVVHLATTADLTMGALAVNLWDEDTGGLDTNDFICSAQVQITNADLEAGGIRFSCSKGTAAYRFHFVP